MPRGSSLRRYQQVASSLPFRLWKLAEYGKLRSSRPHAPDLPTPLGNPLPPCPPPTEDYAQLPQPRRRRGYIYIFLGPKEKTSSARLPPPSRELIELAGEFLHAAAERLKRHL